MKSPKKTFTTQDKFDKTKYRKDDIIVGDGGVTEAGWHSTEQVYRCPQAYQYGHVRGIHKPQAQMPQHFTKGLVFAATRCVWFARKFDTSEKTWQAIRDAALEEAEKSRLPMAGKDVEEALALMGAYIDFWGKRPKPKPRAVEYKLGPFPLAPGDPLSMYKTGRLDDLSEYPEAGGALCIGEAKTTTDDFSNLVRMYELHGQPMLYKTLYHMATNGQAVFGPISGVILDIVKKPEGKQGPKFARILIEVTDFAMDWFVKDSRRFIKLAASIQWDSDVFRNITSCTYMAGRARIDCAFKSLCRFGKSMAGQYVLADGSSLKAHVPQPGKEKMPWE